MKHTPESCVMFNDVVRKKFKEFVANRVEIAKKHEIKVISAYTSILDHFIYYIIEAPSQQAIENYFLEMGFAFWKNVEIRQARPVEDVVKRGTGE